jgi:uncharacterized protein YndB with AHSA1/START domain
METQTMTELLKEKIKQRTFIAATPDKVYDTITSAKEWNSFFTTGMVLEPRPGGKCEFSWKDWGPDNYTLKVPGKVIVAEKPGKFIFQWGPEEKATMVSFELSSERGGTVVTLTEHGYKNTPESRAMMLECATGWGEAVTLLKFYIENGIVYKGPENN